MQLLTSLTINNKHSASTANTLSVTSQGLVFNVTDDGSTTTLGEVSSPFLTSFGFTGDKALVLGQLDLENTTAAAVTTTAGSILDDGNSLTAISAKKITLTATGGIGAAGQSIGIDTTDFTVTTAGNLHIANRGHFSFLGITSRHADADADHTFSVTGQNLDFALTDAKATGYTVSRVIDSGFGAGGGLNLFTFSGDRDITLGEINTGHFDYSYTPTGSNNATMVGNGVKFTSTGGILDDGIDTTTVLASYIALSAGKSVGQSDASKDIDVVAKGLVVSAGTASDLAQGAGGIHIAAKRPGAISNDVNRLTLGSAGSVLGSGFATSSGDVVVKLAAGDIALGSSGSLGTLSGNVTLEATAGSILNPNQNATIQGTKVTLTAAADIGSAIASEAVRVNATEIVATAATGRVSLANSGGDLLDRGAVQHGHGGRRHHPVPVVEADAARRHQRQ